MKHVSPIEIHCQLTQAYGESIISVQHVKKWCRGFRNGPVNNHHKEHTSWPSMSRMVLNAAQVEELILEN
jgi:hypothetical protein